MGYGLKGVVGMWSIGSEDPPTCSSSIIGIKDDLDTNPCYPLSPLLLGGVPPKI